MLDKYICLTRKLSRCFGCFLFCFVFCFCGFFFFLVFLFFFLMGNYKTPKVSASTESILLDRSYPRLSNKVQMNCNVS